MSRHPANNGKGMLTAWIDPVLRDTAKAIAKEEGIPFSEFVGRAIRTEAARATAAWAIRDAEARQRAVDEMKRTATKTCSLCGRPLNTFLTRNGHECPEDRP